MLIQLQLGVQAVAHGDSIDAIRLVDAAVDVQEELIHQLAAILYEQDGWYAESSVAIVVLDAL